MGRLLNLDAGQMLRWAGRHPGGRVMEFLRDAADSKQLHAAKAAADGLTAATWRATDSPAPATSWKAPGHGRGHVARRRSVQAVRPAGARWALAETSFVPRLLPPRIPAADALAQQALREHGLSPDDIERVVTHAPGRDRRAGTVTDPRTVHQSKFSMGTVLALAALQAAPGWRNSTPDWTMNGWRRSANAS